MYKKVELNGDEVLQDGIAIGQVVRKFNGGVEVRLKGKVGLRFAFYGTLAGKDDFYQYCKNRNCGPHCLSAKKPSCRNNEQYSKKGGLYINI